MSCDLIFGRCLDVIHGYIIAYQGARSRRSGHHERVVSGRSDRWVSVVMSQVRPWRVVHVVRDLDVLWLMMSVMMSMMYCGETEMFVMQNASLFVQLYQRLGRYVVGQRVVADLYGWSRRGHVVLRGLVCFGPKLSGWWWVCLTRLLLLGQRWYQRVMRWYDCVGGSCIWWFLDGREILRSRVIRCRGCVRIFVSRFCAYMQVIIKG